MFMLVFFLFFGDNNIGHTLLFPAPTQPTPNGTMVYCPTALDIPRKEGRVFRDSHLNATNPLAPICSKKLFLPFGSKRVFLQGLLAPDEAAREVSQQGTFDGRLGNWPHQCQRNGNQGSTENHEAHTWSIVSLIIPPVWCLDPSQWLCGDPFTPFLVKFIQGQDIPTTTFSNRLCMLDV